MLVTQESVDRPDVQDALRPRWPDITLKYLGNEEPVWELSADNATDPGRRRRGAEPFRVVVMPQWVTRVSVAPVPVIEATPVLVSEVQLRTTAHLRQRT
jgi:hypothetical protein